MEEQTIKGPGLRLGIDVRRVWKCPECDRVKRTPGFVTSTRCHRSKCNHAWMRLLDPPGRAPKGLQIDLAERLAERAAAEASSKPVIDPDAAMKAVSVVSEREDSPRTASTPGSEVPSQTANVQSPVDLEPSKSSAGDSPADARPAEAESSGDDTDPQAKPKKRRRRGRRRGRKRSSGGSSGGESSS